MHRKRGWLLKKLRGTKGVCKIKYISGVYKDIEALYPRIIIEEMKLSGRKDFKVLMCASSVRELVNCH